MATEITQAVIEKLQTLPLAQQRQVLEFVEGLEEQDRPPKTVFEMAQECIKDVPPEVLAQLPADGSLKLDHYLYGAPKKGT